MNSTVRIHKWDNLKSVLMFLVVIGHFSNQFTDNEIMQSISLFIYSFHMPLFIFVSGLFSKNWEKDSRFSWDKPLYYVMIGYLLKIMIYAEKIMFGRNPHFHFFEDTGIPWFMFALAGFMVLTYYSRKWNWIFLLPASILMACIAGYFDQIGNFLYLSRIFVFFPFYYVGYLMKPKKVLEMLDHRWMRWSSLLVLGVAACICIFCIDDYYSYIRLFTARNAYEFIHVAHCGALHRLIWYAIAVVMSLSVISLIPNKEYKLADQIGQRTLQIYFWHRLFLYALIYSGFVKSLSACLPAYWEFVYLAIAVVITLILIPRIYALPLNLLKSWERAVEKLFPKRSYA